MWKKALENIDEKYIAEAAEHVPAPPAAADLHGTIKKGNAGNLDFAFVDMVLIGIYSGWRPQELATLKKSDIDLDAKTMFGGLKTEAGKNRYVPIHSKYYRL